MTSRARLALVGCALLAAFALLARWVLVRDEPTAATPAPHAVAEAPIRAREALAEPGRESAGRVELADVEPSPAAPRDSSAMERLEPAPDEALLRVRVVSRESGSPIAGIKVQLTDQEFKGVGAWVPRARARPNEIPRTDDGGWAEFLVPEGKEWGVVAIDGEGAWGHVPALARGEIYETVLRVAREEEIVFFGRVVAVEDGAPLAGASVHLHSRRGARAPVLSGPDGVFELRGNGVARIQATGFAPVLFHLAEGHASVADVFEVRVQRAASVVAWVRNPAGAPVPGAQVSLSTSEIHLILPETLHLFGMSEVPGIRDWTATADDNGRCSLEDLPPLVPLTLELRMAGAPPQPEPALNLQPGEEREIRLSAGGGIELRGLLVDQHGRPVVDQGILLLRPEAPLEFQTLIYGGEDPLAESRTDTQGRFTIPDVRAGTWLIGPAPENSFGRDGEQPEEERIAHRAFPIEVGTVSPQEILLRVDRGLYIRGRVVDPKGDPAQASVLALPEQELLLGIAFTAEVEEGAFVLGPLLAGRYRLTASGSVGDAESEPVLAESGDRDVLLRLRIGGRVEGQVVDGITGLPRSADVSIRPRDKPDMVLSGSSGHSEFHFESLPAGTYGILARSGVNVGWLAGLDLGPGEARTGLRVELERGSGLRVWNRSDRWGYFEVRLDGYWIETLGVAGGDQSRAWLPAGHAEVRLHLGETERTIEIDLVAGEEREISFQEEQR